MSFSDIIILMGEVEEHSRWRTVCSAKRTVCSMELRARCTLSGDKQDYCNLKLLVISSCSFATFLISAVRIVWTCNGSNRLETALSTVPHRLFFADCFDRLLSKTQSIRLLSQNAPTDFSHKPRTEEVVLKPICRSRQVSWFLSGSPVTIRLIWN